MAEVRDLEMLAALEEEYGIEVSQGGGTIPDGGYHGFISEESEVRESSRTGAPRLMVKVEIDQPEDYAGRKPTDFYGWFASDAEKTKTVRGMFLGLVQDILKSNPDVPSEDVVEAFRQLPKGIGSDAYAEAHDALTAIRDVLVGYGVYLVTRTKEDQTRFYFVEPSDKRVRSLSEEPATV